MTDSNRRLEQRYRWLLHLYPRRYREGHEEEMLGVLMHGVSEDQSRPTVAELIDLVGSAARLRVRRWWLMDEAEARGALAVRHPLLVIRIRLAVALWLTVVAVVLCLRGYWWGLGVIFFIALHLLLARRTAAQQRPPSGGATIG